MLRIAFTALALVAAVAGATTAAAVTYNVTSVGAYNLGRVQMTGTIAGHGAFDSFEYAGPVVLQGVTDGGAAFSVITYCFDILHPISAGFGYQANLDYVFSAAPITTDQSSGPGLGNSLTPGQIQRMSGIARLGATLFQQNASDLTARMTAAQAAIWSIEYGLTASNFSESTAQGYFDDYIGRSFSRVRPVPGLIARNAQGQIVGGQQGLVNGSVPEPQSWALLIVGFGLIGVSARRRRDATVAA